MYDFSYEKKIFHNYTLNLMKLLSFYPRLLSHVTLLVYLDFKQKFKAIYVMNHILGKRIKLEGHITIPSSTI